MHLFKYSKRQVLFINWQRRVPLGKAGGFDPLGEFHLKVLHRPTYRQWEGHDNWVKSLCSFANHKRMESPVELVGIHSVMFKVVPLESFVNWEKNLILSWWIVIELGFFKSKIRSSIPRWDVLVKTNCSGTVMFVSHVTLIWFIF